MWRIQCRNTFDLKIVFRLKLNSECFFYSNSLKWTFERTSIFQIQYNWIQKYIKKTICLRLHFFNISCMLLTLLIHALNQSACADGQILSSFLCCSLNSCFKLSSINQYTDPGLCCVCLPGGLLTHCFSPGLISIRFSPKGRDMILHGGGFVLKWQPCWKMQGFFFKCRCKGMV